VVPQGLSRHREPAGPPAEAVTTAPPTTAPQPVPSTATAASTTRRTRPSAVVRKVRIDGFAEGLTFGAGSLWMAAGDRLLRLDPRTDRIVASIPVASNDSGPAGVAFGAGAVWLPVAVPGSVWRVDPASNKVVARIPLGASLAGFIGVAVSDSAVWITSGEQRGGVLFRIDPRRNRVTARLPLPGVPSDVAATRQSVWVTTTSGQVLVVEAGRGRIIGAVETGGPLGFTQTVALAAGAVWLADPLAKVVLRVDPASLRVVARIATGPVTALTAGENAVWAVGPHGILRIDPSRNRVTASLPASELSGVLMVTAGAGWLWAGGADTIAKVDPRRVSA
jgi:DNA-binding beta-propeller fold protein YncE